MAEQVWADLPRHYEGTSLDAFVLMPDHMHGIVILGGGGGRSSLSLPDLIHRFKSFTTTQYRLGIALHVGRASNGCGTGTITSESSGVTPLSVPYAGTSTTIL